MEPFHRQMDWGSWDASSPQQIQAHEGTTQQGNVRDLQDSGTATSRRWGSALCAKGVQ